MQNAFTWSHFNHLSLRQFAHHAGPDVRYPAYPALPCASARPSAGSPARRPTARLRTSSKGPMMDWNSMSDTIAGRRSPKPKDRKSPPLLRMKAKSENCSSITATPTAKSMGVWRSFQCPAGHIAHHVQEAPDRQKGRGPGGQEHAAAKWPWKNAKRAHT